MAHKPLGTAMWPKAVQHLAQMAAGEGATSAAQRAHLWQPLHKKWQQVCFAGYHPPVLHSGVLDLSILGSTKLHHRSMQLVLVVGRGGAPLHTAVQRQVGWQVSRRCYLHTLKSTSRLRPNNWPNVSKPCALPHLQVRHICALLRHNQRSLKLSWAAGVGGVEQEGRINTRARVYHAASAISPRASGPLTRYADSSTVTTK